MYNRDEIEGKAKELKGRAKQAAGNVSNDENMRSEGEAEEVAAAHRKALAPRAAKSATLSRRWATQSSVPNDYVTTNKENQRNTDNRSHNEARGLAPLASDSSK